MKPDAVPHLSLHHAQVFVRDLDRSLLFYTEHLGFRLIFDQQTENLERFIAVAPPDGSTFLGLISPDPDSVEYKLIGQTGNLVFATDDIAAKYAEWSGRGVVFRQLPRATSWKGVVATFADPDGNRFSLMSQDDLSRQIEAERRAVAEREESERRAAHEMEIAREFQSRLFPQPQSTLRTLDFAGRCIQARQVGGDYFDCLPLGGDSVGLVIGDISGKGIAAALLMANLQAVVRGQLMLAVEDPQRFVRAVNKHLFENTTSAAYATLFFGVYHESSGQFRYVSCGHPPAILIRANGDSEELASTSTVLGLFANFECAFADMRLDAGDTLVLYTDGVTECVDAAGDEFGTERLTAVLRRTRNLCAAEILDGVVAELLEFGGQEQQDDITVVVAKRRDR